MTIKIISDNKFQKKYIRKKTNEFLNTSNKDWIDRIYLYKGDILFRLFDGGVSLDSLQNTDRIYAAVRKYIEFLFFNTEISVYGAYDMNRLLLVKGVKIFEI